LRGARYQTDLPLIKVPSVLKMSELHNTSNTQLRAALAASDERFIALMNNSSDAVVITDPNGVIEYVNAAAESLFQRDKSVLLRTTLGFPLTPGDCADVEIAQAGGGQCVAEMRHSRIVWNGDEAVLVMLRDRTEHSLLTEALERSKTDLEGVISAISHDTIPTLCNLNLLAGWLQEDHAGDMNTDALEDVQLMRKSGASVQRTLENIVSYCSVGRDKRFTRQVDLNKVLEDALDNLKNEIFSTNAQVFSEPLPKVDCNVPQMVNLFEHIVSNAVAYCTSTPKIDITVTRDEDLWVIAFKDNGVGMEKSSLNNIFVPFKHLHSNEPHLSSGIGLATCKKVVQEHQGKIWIKSEPSVGTLVSIGLPEFSYKNSAVAGSRNSL